MKLKVIALAAILAGAGLAGCAYDGRGYGYGHGRYDRCDRRDPRCHDRPGPDRGPDRHDDRYGRR